MGWGGKIRGVGNKLQKAFDDGQEEENAVRRGEEALIGAQKAFEAGNEQKSKPSRTHRRDRKAAEKAAKDKASKDKASKDKSTKDQKQPESASKKTETEGQPSETRRSSMSSEGSVSTKGSLPPLPKRNPNLQTEPGDMGLPLQGVETLGIENGTSLGTSASSTAGLDRIYRRLRQAVREHPELKLKKEMSEMVPPLSFDDVEKILGGLIKGYVEALGAMCALDEEIKTMEKDYSTSKAEVAREKKGLVDQISNLERENEKAVARLHGIISAKDEALSKSDQKSDIRVKALKEQHDQEMQNLKYEYEQVITRLKYDQNQSIQRLNQQLNRMQVDHQTQLQDMKARHENERISSNSSHSIQVQKLKNEEKRLGQKIEQLGVNHEEKIRRMEEKHKNDLAIGKISADDELERVKTDLESQLSKAHSSLVVAKQTYDKKLDEMEDDQDALIKVMKEAHERELVSSNRELRKQLEDLKGAMITRDHFKSLSDYELSSRFEDISSDVDEFARVEWDKQLELSWPFRNQILQKSANERRTKQHLLQNNLWFILYERVFKTPFRALGEEGRSLETAWVQAFGQDTLQSTGAPAHCPKPSKESERWRYEAMKRCFEATNQTPGEKDYNIKMEYEASLQATTEEISGELEKVAGVQPGEKQRMATLVKKAAKLWLEVGQQRYRMFLLMSDTGDEPARSDPAALGKDHSMSLVVIPELRRIGNAHGERLEMSELVMGCKGKFSVFHGR